MFKWLMKGLGITLLSCSAMVAFAAQPQNITFQGYLTDNTGIPVTAKTPKKTIGFALYSSQSGKTPLWAENQDVTIDKGIYSVSLGSVVQLNLPFDNQYYLGITIPPDQEMTPRQALTNGPYTFRAKVADGVSMACQDGGVMIYKTGTWQCGAVTTLPNAAATCVGTNCTISMCSPGFGDCNKQVPDGCEVNLKTVDNCGACGKACSAPHMGVECATGTCVTGSCSGGWANCNNDPSDGCEISLTTDLNNCGACGAACSQIPNGTMACFSGNCVIGACNAGFGDCNGNPADGCETNLKIDLNNCGGCNMPCPSGNCSNGVCIPKTQGVACNANNECASTFCIDNVCCNNACNGTCQSCNQAGKTGTCSPIPLGTDPGNECTDQGAASCGTVGYCGGSGACAYYSAGTVAVAASCSSGVYTPPSTCNGSGTANPAGSTYSCSPYSSCASSSACKSSCSIDVDCVGGYFCNGGVCQAKITSGSVCSSNNACQSAVCGNNNICCSTSCIQGGTCGATGCATGTGSCNYPSAETLAGTPTCTSGIFTPASSCNGSGGLIPGSGSPCPGNLICASGSACLTTCTSNSDCASGTCDGADHTCK